MNKEQYEQFQNEDADLHVVSLDDLADKNPRTLLYGYDVDRSTFHVYIDPVDGDIHVLKYVTTGPIAAEQVLVLKHTNGISGGVSSNDDFVPSKRLYPESCDMEFCQLLRRQGVSLPFTTFSDSGPARLERHGGFAGYVATAAMFNAVAVGELQVSIAQSKFGDGKLLGQMIHEACIETGARYAVRDDKILVAEPDVTKVVDLVQTYHASLSFAATEDPLNVEFDITREALLFAVTSTMYNSYPDRFGGYTYSIDFPEEACLNDHVPGHVRYEGPSGVKAQQGLYAGRPYLVVLKPGDRSQVHVNLYGPQDKFIEELVKRHQLTQKTAAS